MAEIEKELHGLKFKLDNESDTLKDLAYEWKHKMSREDIERIAHDARHAPGRELHLEDGKTTLIHNDDGTYTLKKRNI
jgi:hypothetical protein